ncbi:leucine-rich repeat-containing protein 18 [Notolabrus celidotus]|uniref:leucine-rich repeat-containing protein 18 n=1 Tax=Notolabrus celidotus TaxID=1203425 RepID=UPI0014907B78|nr:leucine-rich repeat-containing protein 18 [Notolabrus celidotus]
MNMLDALPSSIAALKELRHIGLSDNRFTRVPSCLSRLIKLERVILDRNPLLTEETPSLESLAISERLYMVKKSILCEDCLTKFQTERKKLEDAERNEYSTVVY